MAAERTTLVIGTRGSALALWQAEFIAKKVAAITGLPVERKVIKTTGDKVTDVPLAKVGGKGLFTKEIEVELSAGTVDLAVHSMKDVPTELPEGLFIAAMPKRVDARDVVISRNCYNLDTLPTGARVGTSSLRRRSQLLALRPDVEIVDVRGNLDTRMRKAEEGELDAVLLAAAGIKRLEWGDRISHYLEPQQMCPAVGQGAIGIEIRDDDEFMRGVCERIDDKETSLCVTAERVVMSELEGGCQVPIGAFARLDCSGALLMDAMVGSVDGSRIVRRRYAGTIADCRDAGAKMVDRLREGGADEILAEVRAAAGGSLDELLAT